MTDQFKGKAEALLKKYKLHLRDVKAVLLFEKEEEKTWMLEIHLVDKSRFHREITGKKVNGSVKWGWRKENDSIFWDESKFREGTKTIVRHIFKEAE